MQDGVQSSPATQSVQSSETWGGTRVANENDVPNNNDHGAQERMKQWDRDRIIGEFDQD